MACAAAGRGSIPITAPATDMAATKAASQRRRPPKPERAAYSCPTDPSSRPATASRCAPRQRDGGTATRSRRLRHRRARHAAIVAPQQPQQLRAPGIDRRAHRHGDRQPASRMHDQRGDRGQGDGHNRPAPVPRTCDTSPGRVRPRPREPFPDGAGRGLDRIGRAVRPERQHDDVRQRIGSQLAIASRSAGVREAIWASAASCDTNFVAATVGSNDSELRSASTSAGLAPPATITVA